LHSVQAIVTITRFSFFAIVQSVRRRAPDIKKTGPGPFQAFMIAYRQALPQGRFLLTLAVSTKKGNHARLGAFLMIDLRTILAVGVGAAIGGIGRLLVTQLVVARAGAGAAPWATMFINVSGSFLIGIVIELATSRAGLPPIWRYFLATGILGGYTTFSTFSFEALSYWTGGLTLTALFYVVGSVLLGIGAAFAGILTARAVAL
jgi:CrcB protein